MQKKICFTIVFLVITILFLKIPILAISHNDHFSKANNEEIAKQQLDSANKYFLFDFDIAEQYAQNAINFSIKSGNNLLIINSYQLKAKIQKYSYRNSEASETIFKAIFYALVSRNEPKVIDLTIDLAEVMRSIGNINIALEYLYNLEDVLNRKDSLNLSRVYNRIAAIFFEMNRYDYSLSFAQKSIKLIDENINPLLYADNKVIVGASLSRVFRNDEALKEILAAKKVYEKYSPLDLPYILFNLCQAYSYKGDYKNAIKYGLMSFELAKKSKIDVYMQNAALYLIRAYLRARDVDNSLKYLKISDSLSLKLNIISQIQKISNEQTDNKLKLKEDKIIEYKQSIERNTRIISLTRWIVIILTFLIIITIVYLYNSNKKSKMLRELNEEILKQRNELVKFSNELQEANSAKNTFFSIISHDLRSPFHSILGLSDVLMVDYEQLSDEEKKNIVKMLNDSANNIFRLLDNLLKWSQSQVGAIKYEPENLNIKELINGVIKLTRNFASDKNIKIEYHYNLDINVFADKITLETVIRNVLLNAIKFSHMHSKIVINVEKINNHINIITKDFGIGISKVEIEKLFSINQKNIRHGTKGEKGSGLGLVLCKEFTELNKGKIFVESSENVGTTVTIQLPINKIVD